MVVASGVVTLALTIATALADPVGMSPPTDPPTWPALPLGAVVALLAAASAGYFSAPRPEEIP
jgi:hypothetical protein